MRLVLELTLGLSTLDWYSAWNCVPSKSVSDCCKVKGLQRLLLTNEVGVILQFEDLHALACLVLSDEMQTSGLQAVNVRGIDFITVTMSLLDFKSATV